MLTRHLAAAYHHAILSPCSSEGDLDIDWICPNCTINSPVRCDCTWSSFSLHHAWNMYFGTCELYQLQKVSVYVYSFYYVTKVVPGQLTLD